MMEFSHKVLAAARLAQSGQAARTPLAFGGANSATTLPEHPNNIDKDGLAKAAQAFEAVILRQLIGTMRSAKLADDIMGSSATDNFREMADARTADQLAKLGAFGIARLIEQQFAKHLEQSATPDAAAARDGQQDKGAPR